MLRMMKILEMIWDEYEIWHYGYNIKIMMIPDIDEILSFWV